MKKLMLTLSSLVVLGLCAKGQTAPNASSRPDIDYTRQLIAGLLQQDKPTANKTTTVGERLIAQSYYYVMVHPTSATTYTSYYDRSDSFYYRYLGGHGSVFDLNNMAFFNYYSLLNAPFWSGTNVNQFLNSSVNILCDKSYHWQHNDNILPAFPFEMSDSITQLYDGASRLTGHIFQPVDSSAYVGEKYINDYNADGTINTSLNFYSFPTTVFDTGQLRYFFYDVAGKLTTDTSYRYNGSGWDPGYTFVYTYNAADKLTQIKKYIFSSGSWNLNNRYDILYYTDGRLKSVTNWLGTSISSRDSFGWTGTVNYVTCWKTEMYGGASSLTYSGITRRQISSATLLPDTAYTESYNPSTGATSKTRTVYTYDSYLQPTLAETYSYNSISGIYDSVSSRAYYYYETYDNTAVDDAVATGIVMSAYPNPTTSDVNISFNDVAKGSSIRIRLFNTLGQSVADQQYSYTGDILPLSLSNRAPGIYWLVAEDNHTHTTYRQAIVKQ